MVRLMRGLDDAPYDLILAYYYPRQILKPTPTPEFDFASTFSRGSTPIDASLSDDGIEDYFTYSKSDTEPTKDMAALVENLSALRRDFDPVAFMKRVGAAMHILREDAYPGSYKHFLLMLLVPDRAFVKMQHGMQKWLADQFPKRQFVPTTGAATSMWMMDKGQLTEELEVLRRLVKPLRKGKMESLWNDRGYEYHENSVKGLRKASNIIEEFKEDVTASIEGDEVDDIPAPIGTKRMASLSMRMIRVDACRAVLVRKHSPSQEPVTFGQYYERYQRGRHELHTTIHDKDIGIREPTSPPHLPSVENLPPLLHDAEIKDSPQAVLDIMLNIARWLSRTRCTEAVDLFCDVGRIFSPTEPATTVSDSRYSILRTLCDAVFTPDNAKPASPRRPYWKSGKGLLPTNSQWEHDACESHKSMLSVLKARMTDEEPSTPEGSHGHRLTSLTKVRRCPEAKLALSVLEEHPLESRIQLEADGQLGSKNEDTVPAKKEQQNLSDEKEELRKQLEKTHFFLGGEDSDSSSSDDEDHASTDEKISKASFEALAIRGSPPTSYLGTSI